MIPTQNAELAVSWEEYHRSIELLALKIHQSGWQFDQILCLARGGLRIGDIFSRIFKLPLAILSVSSYRDEDGTKQSTLNIAPTISATIPYLEGRVLIVDDLVDTGGSASEVMKILPAMFPKIIEMKSAVIWYKQSSTYAPDFYLTYLVNNPWIVQPFEKYDCLSIQELSTSNQDNGSSENNNEHQELDVVCDRMIHY